MNNKYYLCLIICLTLSGSFDVAFGQYQKTFFSPLYDWPTAIDGVNNGGYVVGGHQLNTTWHPFMLRMDEKGQIMWSRTYHLTPGLDETFNHLKSSENAGALFVATGQADGHQGSLGSFDIYFVLIDDVGNVVKASRIGSPEGEVGMYVGEFKGKSGAGFVVLGRTAHSLSDNDLDINISITDDQGNLQKGIVLHYAGDQTPYSVESTSDGGFIIIGTTELNKSCDGTIENVFIIKLGSKLNVEWNKVIDIAYGASSSEDIGYSIKEGDHGEFYLTGVVKGTVSPHPRHAFIAQLDKYGGVKYLYVYEHQYQAMEVRALLNRTAPDGTIENTLSGWISTPLKASVFKVGSEGDVIWSKLYDPENSKAENITYNRASSGYAFTGRVFTGSASSYDIDVVEMDKNGNSVKSCEYEFKLEKVEASFCEERLELTDVTYMRQQSVIPVETNIILDELRCDESAANMDLEGQSIKLYPVPAQDQITIATQEDVVNIEIKDMSGKLQKVFEPTDDNVYDISGLRKGMYVIILHKSNGGSERLVLIKE